MLSGREYQDLIQNHSDENTVELTILRTSFMYESQYFQIETYTNVDSYPTFLRVETTIDSDQGDVKIPPFLKIKSEITDDCKYASRNLACKGFKMDTLL